MGEVLAESSDSREPRQEPIQTLDDLARVYHWANIILNPFVLAIGLSPDASEDLKIAGIIWVVISSLINPGLSGCITGYIGAVITGTIALLGIGSLAALIVAFVLFTIAASAIGAIILTIALVYLWVTSLIALRLDWKTN